MLQRKSKLLSTQNSDTCWCLAWDNIWLGGFCSNGISLEQVAVQVVITNVEGSQLWLFSSLWMPVTVCGKENLFFRKAVSWISSVLCFLPRFALRFIRPDPRSRVTDPVGDIISFIHMFEEKYGRIHPVFYQGTYSQVSVTCWCIDPGEMESGDFARWYQGLHGKITLHLKAQRLSPNSLTG